MLVVYKSILRINQKNEFTDPNYYTKRAQLVWYQENGDLDDATQSDFDFINLEEFKTLNK